MGSLEGVYGIVKQPEHDCEPKEDFFDRCKRWWDTWIVQVLMDKEPREEPYSILATSHGAFLGVLAGAAPRHWSRIIWWIEAK
jgi:broad specificity phosphatase PhoE